jgi:S-DNA-T family DNA segregation ATPase FtsK/SpoIIIE
LLTTAEIERVVSALKKVSPPHYLTFVDSSLIEGKTFLQEEDALLYAQVKNFLLEIDEVSISLLQRRFRIGYNRAARIIEAFQAEGIILPPDGSKVRKILR